MSAAYRGRPSLSTHILCPRGLRNTRRLAAASLRATARYRCGLLRRRRSASAGETSLRSGRQPKSGRCWPLRHSGSQAPRRGRSNRRGSACSSGDRSGTAREAEAQHDVVDVRRASRRRSRPRGGRGAPRAPRSGQGASRGPMRRPPRSPLTGSVPTGRPGSPLRDSTASRVPRRGRASTSQDLRAGAPLITGIRDRAA